MGLLSRAAGKALKRSREGGKDLWVRRYHSEAEGVPFLLQVEGGAGRHPVVEWGLSDVPARRVAAGKESARLVREAMRMDSRMHRPSAYEFSLPPKGGASRLKMYKGLLSRANADYRMEPVPQMPFKDRVSELGGAIGNVFNRGPSVSLGDALQAVRGNLADVISPEAMAYRLVYSPPIARELLETAAINAPLAGLAAAAYGYK